MNNNLAKAVAALLPNGDLYRVEIEHDMLSESMTKSVAFECHKALSDKYRFSDFGRKGITDTSELEDKRVTYGYGEVYEFIGTGDTHEQAIFAAVLDWHEKRGGK